MLKTLLASASLSFAFLLMPLGSVGPIATSGSAGLSTAHAIDIGIELGGDDDDGPTIGIGGGDDDDEGGGDDDGDSADGDDDDDGGKGRLTCGRGKRVVENAGFRRVRARDCNGKNFRYTGRRKGDNFEIRVSSRNGRIVSVRKR